MYEYLAVKRAWGDSLNQYLFDCGEAGWELVSAAQDRNDSRLYALFFKRRVSGDPKSTPVSETNEY